MFASTPDDGEVEGRFNKFKKSIGKFWDDYKKNRRQPNVKEDFLGKSFIYFQNVFGIEAQNEDTPVEITADTSLTFRSSGQQEISARVSISLSLSLLGENMRLRMTCQEQEEKLMRQEVKLKYTKRKASSKGENLVKIREKMYVTKEEKVFIIVTFIL